jgi:predicted metal-binding membrane protein
MMVPSATPMLLAFATISRSRCAQGRAFAPLWVFLAGYLVLWTAFSLAATWRRPAKRLWQPTISSPSDSVDDGDSFRKRSV